MNEIKDLSAKLHRFAALLNLQQLGALKTDGTDCEANRITRATSVKIGPKYSRVDIGNSGRYMVVNATGEIFGIKAYGVIHKGHPFGTLDTIQDWDWSGYRAVLRNKPVEKLAEAAVFVAPAPEPKPAALKLGDRVSATIYGALKQGTVECIAQGGIVFVRWDGAKAPTWLHPQSLTKIESKAERIEHLKAMGFEFPAPAAPSPSGAFLVEGKCFSTQKEAIDYAEARYAQDNIILGIERAREAAVSPEDLGAVSVIQSIQDAINSLEILPDTAGAYRVTCLKQLEQALPKAKALVDALEKIRVAASANSYQIQYEADNLEGLIKTIFNIADEALKAGVAP